MNFTPIKNNISLGIVIVLLSACSSKQDELQIPDYVLKKERYINLLADMAMAESATNLNLLNLAGNAFDSAYAFNPLKENKIEKAIYDSTTRFYTRNPQALKEIFDEVLIELSNRKLKKENKNTDTLK
ncbi:MAG: DUF4296 domain-containing protein [Sphingobacteriaceae bacterium]|nr:DUF4296 domain-containing protein [Sphingobacteriaceae bacterium]